MIGADPGQPDEIASLFWENLSVFPEELMEAEEKRKCLGFPAETAVLLTSTSNLQNPRTRNEPKLLFIPISIHHTLISSVQDRRRRHI